MKHKIINRMRNWIKERDRKRDLIELENRTKCLESAYRLRPYREYNLLQGEHDPTSFSREAHDKAYAGISRVAIKDGIDVSEFDERVFEARRIFYFENAGRL